MTAPQLPDEPNYWLRRLFEAVDAIDKKIDGHAEKLAVLEAGHAQHGREIAELKADDKARTAVVRANISFAVTTLIAVAAVVVALIVH